MIKRLKRRLIFASMLSLILVLCLLIGTASALNYKRILENADNTLEILRDNDGKFPLLEDGSFPKFKPYMGAVKLPDVEEDTEVKAAPAWQGADGSNSGIEWGEERFSRELPFEARFFIVKFSEEGATEEISLGRISAVDEETAEAYGSIVIKNGRTQGFIDDYRYLSYEEDGRTRVIFLDCVRSLEEFRRFLRNIAAVCLLGLVAVLAVLSLVSERILRPFSENYEKQRRFITDAGHELKTPLAIMRADIDLVEMDYGESEWTEDIRRQIDRLTELTGELIFLSRMEERADMEARIINISELTEKAAESFRAISRLQNKSLRTEIEKELRIFGNQEAIERLLNILLDNAFKYSAENGDIYISLSQKRNSIMLSVYNSCEYISRESIRHIFDRFYRTDRSRNSGTGGFGLGLSIAAAIVKAQRGELEAETEDEHSIRFKIRFPVISKQ